MSNDLNIKFNDYGLLKDLLIENYNRYINYKKFVNKLENTITIVSNDDNFAIETFFYNDINNINKINNSVVFIDCVIEGIHSIKYFNRYNKSNFYVIFSNSMWNREKYNLEIDYINLDYYFYIQKVTQCSVSVYNENYFYPKEYIFDYPKDNIFISTTGYKRKERDRLVNNLIKKLNYKNFIFKYQGENLGQNFDQYDTYLMPSENFNPYKPIIGDITNISDIVPTDLYNQAYFNLTVESDIDYPYSFFPTEKTLKVLLTGIPFVIYATPRFLQNLRNLGFTTYNELWNEDYDLEFDYGARADKIIKLCNELQHFDWQSNKEKLQNIANKNSNLLLKNHKIFIEQFDKISKTLKIIKDKEVQYLKNNSQLFKWLDNNTV